MADMLALLLAALAAPDSIVIRHDRPDSLYRALGQRFPAVAKVGRAGDGTLIAPRWVLTAAHVAATINLGRARVMIGGREHVIRRAVPHPSWRELGPHDIGLLELAEPVQGVQPLPLYQQRDEAGRTVIIVGHGDTRTGLGGAWQADGLARGATSRVAAADSGRLVLRFRAPPDAGELEGAPGRGDSGGPALIETNGQAWVAGVSSAGYDGANGPGTYGAVDHFTRVSDYLAWISGIISAQSQAPAPPPAYSVAAAYDSARGRLIVFGGYASGGYSGATWAWDGTSWSRLDGAAPGPRNAPDMVYDARRGRIVLFGGDTRATGPLGDTWEHDGAAWRQVAASSGPPPRSTHAMAYDARRGRVVMFGGVGPGSTTLGDTWEWDGTRWTQAATDGPRPRAVFGMAYDAGRGRVVLFGGSAAQRPDAEAFGDTWEWDGTRWRQIEGAGPSPREHVALGYDARLQGVVLRGGVAPEVREETWLLRGGTWTRLAVPAPRRSYPRLITNTRTGALMMFGGFDREPSNELWQLDQAGWVRVF